MTSEVDEALRKHTFHIRKQSTLRLGYCSRLHDKAEHLLYCLETTLLDAYCRCGKEAHLKREKLQKSKKNNPENYFPDTFFRTL
jgi:hypothetical protein